MIRFSELGTLHHTRAAVDNMSNTPTVNETVNSQLWTPPMRAAYSLWHRFVVCVFYVMLCYVCHCTCRLLLP